VKRAALLAVVLLASACGYSVAQTTAPSEGYFEGTTAARARAALIDSTGKPIGLATFSENRLGVLVDLSLSNLPKGTHGVHIHAVGKCDGPDFMTAGAHFNPAGAQHGLHSAKGPHAGDLPNVVIGDDGRGSLRYVNPLVTLEAGAANSINGLAIVVDQRADDEQTDPEGNSGARIACGVIDKSA
jgi:Cu-Zn family superoxide dismutase